MIAIMITKYMQKKNIYNTIFSHYPTIDLQPEKNSNSQPRKDSNSVKQAEQIAFFPPAIPHS